MASPTKAEYEAAVAKERAARNSVYVSPREVLCGQVVHNVTPHHLSLFAEAESPFVYGGSITILDVVQFIGILTPEQKPERYWWGGKKKLVQTLADKLVPRDLEEMAAEISDFVELTFMDAPGGSSGFNSAPIASACAWIEYRMLSVPFHWDYETRTKHIPLRRIYQLLRCQDRDAGNTVVNKLSGRIESESLDVIQAGLDAGTITPEQVEEAQARAVFARAGIPYAPTPKKKPKPPEDPLRVIGGPN